MAVAHAVAVGIDPRILISILFRGRGLLQIAFIWRSKNTFFLKISFLTFPYLRIFLTYYFLKDVWLSWPKKLLFRISLIYHFTGFPYLLLFRRMSGWVDLKILFFVSRLVDFRSEFWQWKWLPEGVTHSSTSQKLFTVSRLVDLRIGVWPQEGHPKWSPTRVLANFFFLTRL